MTLQTKLPGSLIQSGSVPVSAITNFTGQLTASLPSGTVSSSAQVTAYLPSDTVSSSVQVTAFLPVGTVSSSTQLPSGIASSSAQVIAYLPSDTVSSSIQVTAFLPSGTVSSSAQLPSGIASSSAQVIDYLPTGTVSQSSQVVVQNTTGISAIATTGSNTFTGIQSVSDTTNSTTYLDGAVTVAGGMSVRKDVRVSGSLTVNGLLTAVSMSTQYVTASEYTIGTSKVILNDDDLVRFAGLSIVDSGSSSPATASIYWDSMKHKFIYENLSGSAYNSAIFIAGPKNTGSLGDEVGLTSGYIPVATGDDHIDNSVMFQNGNNIGIGITNPSSLFHVFGRVSVRDGYNIGSSDGNTGIYFNANTAYIQTSGSSRLIIDTSGNLGLAATPPAWGSGYKVLQMPWAALASENGQHGQTIVSLNAFNSGNVSAPLWTYVNNGRASMYLQDVPSGMHAWYTAASGTAGNAITFTQAMTLNVSGSLGIGTTSPGTRFHVNQSTDNSGITLGHSGRNASRIEWEMSGTNNEATSFYHNNDTNKYLMLQMAREYLTVSTNNIERIRIDVSGNALIGNTSNYGVGETNSLQVKGPIVLAANNTGSADNRNWQMTTNVSGPGNLDFHNSPSNNSWPNEAYRLTIKSNGNVGIGTTNPSTKLTVYGGNILVDSNFAGMVLNRLGTTYQSDIRFQTAGTNNWAIGQGAGIVGSNFEFYDYSTSSTKLIILSGSGNIGIGTTNPLAKLHVSGGRTYLGSADGYELAFTRTNNYFYFYNDGGSTTGKLSLTDTGGVGGEIITFTQDTRRVGIGTTNPIDLLHISGSDIGVRVEGGTRAKIILSNPTATWQIESPTATGNVPAGALGIVESGVGSRFTILTGGNVGIGSTNPGTKLVVDDATVSADNKIVTIQSSHSSQLTKGVIGFTNSVFSLQATNIAGSVNQNLLLQPAGGSVGIGTNSVDTGVSVDVQNLSAMSSNVLVRIRNTTLNEDAGLIIDGNSSGTQREYRVGIHTIQNTPDLTFSGPTGYRWFISGSEKMCITGSAGNVGIGTTNPSNTLQVNGTFNVTSTTGDVAYIGSTFATAPINGRILHLRDDKATTLVDSFISIGWTSGPGQDAYAGKRTTSNAGYFAIQNSSGNEIFTIDLANLRVGIGTTAPSDNLDVFETGTGAAWRSRILSRNDTGNRASFLGVYNGVAGVFAHSSALDAWADLYINGVDMTTGNSANVIIPGNVGIGTTNPNLSGGSAGTKIVTISTGTSGRNSILELNGARTTTGEYTGYVRFFNNLAATPLADIQAIRAGTDTTGSLAFATTNIERARITSAGEFLVGTTTGALTNSTNGFVVEAAGEVKMFRAGNTVAIINRNTDDGTIISLRQANVEEGTISVSTTTVSYNGGHLSRWSQFIDGSHIPLLKGTVMSNLDQMAEWIDPETRLPLENEQLNCMKVSDVEGDPNVAGVFVNWDEREEFTSDMNIAMTGDMIIRIAQGVTVQRGDLLISAGDGTAKPQTDDIIRGNTIAKVTSTHVTYTYDDGSYCVPCVLMAC